MPEMRPPRLQYRNRENTRLSIASDGGNTGDELGEMGRGHSTPMALDLAPASCLNCWGLLKSRSGVQIDSIQTMIAEIAGRVVAGRFGFSLLGVLVLAWCTTYPSLTTLPLLCWVLVTASTFNRQTSFEYPRGELVVFLPYICLTSFGFYAACIFGELQRPDVVLHATLYNGGPFHRHSPIFQEYSIAWELCGMVPRLRPVVRLILNVFLFLFLAVYHKLTLLRRQRDLNEPDANDGHSSVASPMARSKSPIPSPRNIAVDLNDGSPGLRRAEPVASLGREPSGQRAAREEVGPGYASMAASSGFVGSKSGASEICLNALSCCIAMGCCCMRGDLISSR